MHVSQVIIVSLVYRVCNAKTQYLAPVQDINFPRSESATNPLQWLGANGPWYAGKVSKYPYGLNFYSSYYYGQVQMYSGFRLSLLETAMSIELPTSQDTVRGTQTKELMMGGYRCTNGNYTASGSLSFLSNWRPVLQDPASQIAMENPTGVKEALDMGYPGLYQEGDEFMVWANNYTRVLQTASMFIRGYLGVAASQKGSIISVTSRGFPAGVGDSLAPSDMCPNFKDSEGGKHKSTWDEIWIPPVQNRLQKLIKGDLSLTAGDIAQIPYLCGFESHITGRLSPWCDVFTDEELKQYEYSNDLRYYYGIGPGTDLPKKMMTPFLSTLVGILQNGSTIGVGVNGSTFNLPKLLVSFLNDGQLTELVTASGVFDRQPALSDTKRDDKRLWVGSRYVSMRGTIAFERLSCAVKGDDGTGTYPSNGLNNIYLRIRLNDAVYPIPSCNNGPGLSCKLSDYTRYVAEKYAAEGDWITNCNVTVTEDTPATVKGASFFTDISKPWVRQLAV
ncbi:phosphoglycerate mutase-like protein [Daldinia decipiens]|uniref:phosphoglycerate mutase-like protein n=1 Tax=Daldinia decipiens TaxID=326647 RepID=UPI0020C3484F|nr:phosphoglycerate mutase-like protein [Daldinia decipiens]KAI1663082.1 phosphoglycerate mutase-like protein [Daldinia decipiens]